jgi:hypothetical protein
MWACSSLWVVLKRKRWNINALKTLNAIVIEIYV